MKYVKYIFILLLVFFVFKCINSTADSTQSISNNTTNEWYIGGKLHNSRVSEWKSSTEANKLATCGDFIAKITSERSMEEIKRMAENLKICIDEATTDTTVVDKENVTQIASSCLILLGY